MLNINIKTYEKIERRYYFEPFKNKLNDKIANVGEVNSLNYLHDIMREAEDEVNEIIGDRVAQKGYDSEAKIQKSIDNTRKAVAGNGFQGLVAYSLIKAQKEGEINPNLIMTLRPKKHKLIKEFAAIKIGAETQKPDIDLIIFHKNTEDNDNYPIMIYSLKTSLRERLGQTYKWKLLMEIANSNDCQSVKKKYGLSWDTNKEFKMGLITTNFYNEIMQPQQKGLLNFFDYVYIAKSGEWEAPVKCLSTIVDDLENIFGLE